MSKLIRPRSSRTHVPCSTPAPQSLASHRKRLKFPGALHTDVAACQLDETLGKTATGVQWLLQSTAALRHLPAADTAVRSHAVAAEDLLFSRHEWVDVVWPALRLVDPTPPALKGALQRPPQLCGFGQDPGQLSIEGSRGRLQALECLAAITGTAAAAPPPLPPPPRKGTVLECLALYNLGDIDEVDRVVFCTVSPDDAFDFRVDQKPLYAPDGVVHSVFTYGRWVHLDPSAAAACRNAPNAHNGSAKAVPLGSSSSTRRLAFPPGFRPMLTEANASLEVYCADRPMTATARDPLWCRPAVVDWAATVGVSFQGSEVTLDAPGCLRKAPLRGGSFAHKMQTRSSLRQVLSHLHTAQCRDPSDRPRWPAHAASAHCMFPYWLDVHTVAQHSLRLKQGAVACSLLSTALLGAVLGVRSEAALRVGVAAALAQDEAPRVALLRSPQPPKELLAVTVGSTPAHDTALYGCHQLGSIGPDVRSVLARWTAGCDRWPP